MNRTTRLTLVGGVIATLPLVACVDRPTPATTLMSPDAAAAALKPIATTGLTTTPDVVRALAAGRGITAMPQPVHVRPELARLGQALTFDPILSGNRNISCGTCHLPAFGTGDGKSLSIGQGGTDLGPSRSHPQGIFIPRNAPPLFNLSAMKHLFWDGRIASNGLGDFNSPAGVQITPAMKRVFEFGAISSIGMFPVTNRAEMRGNSGNNELADVDDADMNGIWSALMARLGAIPEYRQMFEQAYPGTPFSAMTFAHASNAIGGFVIDSYSLANSPWDQFLAGNDYALTPKQLEGAKTFLTLKCSLCHNGATLSDDQFHNVAVAQVGPGEGNGDGGRDDFGRMNVTGNPADRYRFRTTPLRNVELTAPYGHDGSIVSLRGFVEHYSESDLKLLAFDPFELEPALRSTVRNNRAAIIAARDTIIVGVVIPPDLVNKLMDYMTALTDDAARDLRHTIPDRVPSRLPVDRPH